MMQNQSLNDLGPITMRIRPGLSLTALAMAAALFLAVMFWMVHHHNQGANLKAPPQSGGPAS